MSLRLKLLLAASLLLAVPVAGYRFVLAMEAFLRTNQLEAAASSAHTLALAVQGHPGSPRADAADTGPGTRDLYVHSLGSAPQVDGYDTDWAELAPDPATDVAQVRAGSRGETLYLLVRLPPGRGNAPPTGHVRLVLEDAPGLRRAWLMDTATPGTMPVTEVPPAPGVTGPGHRDTRITAALGLHAGNRVLELRLPLSLRAPRLFFELLGKEGVLDRVPDPDTFNLVLPHRGLQDALDELGGVAGRRLRVTDTRGRVLAQAGTLARAGSRSRLTALMEGLLDADQDELLSLGPDTLALQGPEMAAALAGTAMARLRRDPVDEAMVVSAAHPLRSADHVSGVLVLEESTSGIQALARRALLELLATAALAFLAGTALLLFVAGRTAARLAGLRDQARQSVDDEGRVRAAFEAPRARDEIGDLGRSFESAVLRLKGYQDYLEHLARRLSHELRTPIAVIRSSLENMTLNPSDEGGSSPSVERARQGVERLDALIRRMSEATRLELAMTDTERTTVDVAALVDSAVKAHAGTWDGATLNAVCGPEPLPVSGSPDLLLQALDKLMANARDFAAPGTTVTVRAQERTGQVDLCVENQGPGLPDGSSQRLFDSMVSERGGQDDGQPHLGLGLYIVRLVARFHRGREYAENLSPGVAGITGVRVGMRLPRADA